MKIVLTTTLAILLTGASHLASVRAAEVSDFGALVQRNSPTCATHSLRIDRTAFMPEACCDGVKCSQMLATTKVDHPRPSSHT